MATQPISLIANFQWLTSYNVTSEGWSVIASSTDGGTANATFFALGQDMTNSTARDNVFALIKGGISAYYTGVVFTTETHVWSQIIVGINTYNQWAITLIGTATDPSNTGVMMFAPANFYILTTPNLAFGVMIGSAESPCPPSVNPDDATDCLSCYPLEIEFCDSTFDIEGLEADTEYTIKIKDNVSNKTYDYVATSDQYGIIEITTANYPTGVFTPFNSPLSITILDEKGDPVILTYGYVNYSCLELNVTNTTTIV
jgi:hypothetical protein